MSNTPNVKQATLQVLVFIHNKLVATQFYPEEFAEADKSLRLIKDMAEKLNEEIITEAKASESNDQVLESNDQVLEDKPKRGRKAKA